jgi:hypothetical protein
MTRSSRSRQAGISFFGLVFVMAVLAGVGVLVAQAIPTMLEYQATVKVVERIKGGNTPQDIRKAFDSNSQIDDIKSIAGKDLEIVRENDRNVVKFAYNKEIHMFGPAYLLLKYAHSTK